MVGVILGGLALVTLFTIKVIFLVYMAAVIALGLWELTRALEVRGIRLPLVPVAAGGAVMLGLAYYSGERPLVAALADHCDRRDGLADDRRQRRLRA